MAGIESLSRHLPLTERGTHLNMFASNDGHLYSTKEEKLAADARYAATFTQVIWLEPCRANGTAAVQASLIDRTGI